MSAKPLQSKQASNSIWMSIERRKAAFHSAEHAFHAGQSRIVNTYMHEQKQYMYVYSKQGLAVFVQLFQRLKMMAKPNDTVYASCKTF